MPFNMMKTALLLALLTGIFVAMGWVVGGQSGMVIALVLAIGMNMFSLWNSDKIVLRMHNAVEVDERAAPGFYRMVADLSQRAGLPMPKVYVMQTPQPNAFATGRSPSNAAVCASTGLIEMLTPEEQAGVMAHELAHIANRDTLTMTVAASIAGAISMFANMLQFQMLFGGDRRDNGPLGWIGVLAAVIVAPLAALLVQMAVSRSREYAADRLGAQICGEPMWLASALAKIHTYARRIPNPAAERVPATAHMFIINPLTGQGMDNLFSTHPNTENRIAALEELAREMGREGARGGLADAGQPSVTGPWSAGRRGGGTASGSRRGPWG